MLVRRYKDELLSAVLDLLLSAPSTLFPPQASFSLQGLHFPAHKALQNSLMLGCENAG